jgi:hypothetical protein
MRLVLIASQARPLMTASGRHWNAMPRGWWSNWSIGSSASARVLAHEIATTLDRTKSRLDAPVAQRRFAARLRKAGGQILFDLRLQAKNAGSSRSPASDGTCTIRSPAALFKPAIGYQRSHG